MGRKTLHSKNNWLTNTSLLFLIVFITLNILSCGGNDTQVSSLVTEPVKPSQEATTAIANTPTAKPVETTTQPAVIPAPVFEVSNLTVEPEQVPFGQSCSINATVTNTGSSGGNYTAELKISDILTDNKSIFLAAGGKQLISFDVSQNDTGNYTFDIGGIKGQFTVEPLLRTWVLTDADISRLFSQISTVTLKVRFISDNQAEYMLGGFFGITNIAVKEGKLCEYPVDSSVYAALPEISNYIFYVDGVAYLSLAWFDPSVEIAPDVTSMPVMVSVTTEKGQANVLYEWPPRK
jgi:hypothetical protein